MVWQPTGIRQEEASLAPLVVEIDGVSVLMAAVNGRWFAVEDRCSHADCAFSEDGEVDGMVLICNCHGSEFDIRTGEATRMPASGPIRRFSLRVESGQIEVEL